MPEHLAAATALRCDGDAFDGPCEALAECERGGFVHEREGAFEQNFGGRRDRAIGMVRHSRKMA